MNFSRFISVARKFSLVYTLLHLCFCLLSDMPKFHFEIEKPKKILLSNGYSNKSINKYISKFMNKLFFMKLIMLTVPQKQLYLVLTSLDHYLNVYFFCKVEIVFKTSNRFRSYFKFTDIVPESVRSCQIYNFTRASWSTSCKSKAFRQHRKVRVLEHQVVSP